jgi:hypothetical protein
MKTSFLATVVAISLIAFAPLRAHGQIIYDNGPPNQQNGNEMTQWIQAEDFMLTSPANLTSVHFWDIEDPAGGIYQGEINWGLYTDAGGSPGTLFASGDATAVTRIFIQHNVLGFYDEYSDDFNIAPVALAAGTRYWLALHNGPLTTQFRANFYWETTNSNGTPTGHELIAPFNGGWSDNGQEHAFYLDTVPEPSTCILLGLGACALLFAGWRRRAA